MAKSIGRTIKEGREKLGISQSDLAHKLGVSQPMISNWENGNTKPNDDTLRKLSAILGSDQLGTGFELSVWLRSRREELGLSRAELGKKAGISPLTVYFIENGQTESPQENTISRLEKVLGKLPADLTEEVEEEGALEDFEFRGPFPTDEWKENMSEGRIACIYVFYDQLRRPVRIGETDNLERRLTECDKNYWWFRTPTVESFAYVKVNDADFRRKAEKVMIKLVGSNAIFNTNDKIE